MAHLPVMPAEALAGLGLAPFDGLQAVESREGWWVDCTVGGGGHTEAILQATAPGGSVLGLDQDSDTLARTQERLAAYGDRLRLVHANFRQLADVVREQGIGEVRGVLMDLGVSSFQLDEAERGFAFSKPGPLDMRMDRRQPLSAADLVNRADEEELARIFYEYGEEHRSRRIAKAVVRRRPFSTTAELAEAVAAAVGRGGRIHPATRIFQALRIAVNDELGSLRQGLEAARQVLAPGGRLAVISFHSLEDRIVKETLRAGGWTVLTKHVVRPQEREVSENPRSRSARLRVGMRA